MCRSVPNKTVEVEERPSLAHPYGDQPTGKGESTSLTSQSWQENPMFIFIRYQIMGRLLMRELACRRKRDFSEVKFHMKVMQYWKFCLKQKLSSRSSLIPTSGILEEGNGPALAISSAPYLLFVVGARASCIALARFWRISIPFRWTRKPSLFPGVSLQAHFPWNRCRFAACHFSFFWDRCYGALSQRIFKDKD